MPAEAFTADLSHFQFRLLAALCHLQGSGGRFKTSVAELGTLTGNSSDKTVRTALKALEQVGLLTRTPSKRANGYKGMDWYEVAGNYRTEADKVDENYRTGNYRTSHDYKPRSQSTNKPLVPNSQDSNKLKDIETKGFTKEIKIPMGRWEDDGENLAGFGLVEPKDAPQPKIRKSDPKTRGKRPEHEWTPMDVAAEFSFQVGRKYPLLPGTVSVKSLSGALAKFRKQYGTTALVELELLRLFMADERNFAEIGSEAPFLYKKYLASFGKKMNQARENLGLTKVNAPENTSVKLGTLTASDGRVFQNSLAGRTQLERYEKRIGATK